MSNRPPYSLRTRLAVAVSVVTLVVAVASSAVAAQVARRRVLHEQAQLLAALAQQQAGRLAHGMYERYRDVSVLSALPSLANAGTPLVLRRHALDAIRRVYPEYVWFAVVDTAGWIVAGSPSSLEGRSVRDRPWFRDGLHRTYVGDFHEAVLLVGEEGAGGGRPTPFVDLASPLVAPDGDTIGVLAAHLDVRWATVNGELTLGVGEQREGVELLLVAGSGEVIVGPEPLIGDTLQVGSLEAAHAGRRGSRRERWPDGREYIVGHAPSGGYAGYPGLGWAVLLRQPADRAEASVAGIGMQLLLSLVGLGALFAALVWWLTGRLTRPLAVVAASADDLRLTGQGSLRPPPGSPLEVVSLSRALGELVHDLSEARDTAADTAAELETTVEELRSTNDELSERSRELERARAAAETARGEATEILESITDAFYALDRGWRFTYVNRQAERLWRRTREELLGRVIWEVLPQLAGTNGQEELERAMADGQPREFDTLSPLLGVWVRVHVHPRRSGLSVYFHDVSARRRLDEERDRSLRYLRLLERVAVAANEALEPEGVVRVALDEFCELTGWSFGHALRVERDDRLRIRSSGLWCNRDGAAREPFVAATADDISERCPVLADVVAQTEARWIEDVATVPAFARSTAAAAAGLHAALLVPVTVNRDVVAVLEFYSAEQLPADPLLMDLANQVAIQIARVVERRRASQARSLLLERIVDAQEDERRRLSRELHDTMGQYVSALMIDLTALHAGPQSPADIERLARLESVVHAIEDVSRSLALELRPMVLDDAGLASAVSGYAENWSAQTGIPVDVQIAGLGSRRLPTVIETALFRVVQEALNNVARHAHARRGSVILEQRADVVLAIVADDGVGFDIDVVYAAPARRRLGIIGMEERMALVGGTLAVESSRHDGTTVYACAPLALASGGPRTVSPGTSL